MRRTGLDTMGLVQLHWSTANYQPLQERVLWDSLVAIYEEVSRRVGVDRQDAHHCMRCGGVCGVLRCLWCAAVFVVCHWWYLWCVTGSFVFTHMGTCLSWVLICLSVCQWVLIWVLMYQWVLICPSVYQARAEYAPWQGIRRVVNNNPNHRGWLQQWGSPTTAPCNCAEFTSTWPIEESLCRLCRCSTAS